MIRIMRILMLIGLSSGVMHGASFQQKLRNFGIAVGLVQPTTGERIGAAVGNFVDEASDVIDDLLQSGDTSSANSSMRRNALRVREEQRRRDVAASRARAIQQPRPQVYTQIDMAHPILTNRPRESVWDRFKRNDRAVAALFIGCGLAVTTLAIFALCKARKNKSIVLK